MQLDEELPESLEELEKEIEELEKAEISPPPEAAKKRKEPTAPGEKKFSIASIFLGFFVLFGVTFAMLYISISNLLSLLDAETADATQQLILTVFLSLAALPTYPNVLTQVITGNIGLSPPPDITSGIVILALSIITLVAYSATISSDPYVLLVVVGIVPYLLAGLIAGIKNKDPGYGFIAGFIIWIISLIAAAMVVYLFATAAFNISLDITTIFIDLIQWSYMSAMFLAMFGALGGATKKS
ncbi:MAG: hypothetical protein Q6363_000015 [Candidatus Njordarchaeota archaeon]